MTDRANYEFPITIHRIYAGDADCNKQLRNSDFREKGFIVIGVRTADSNLIFAPSADFRLKEGHDIFLLGADEVDRKDNTGII